MYQTLQQKIYEGETTAYEAHLIESGAYINIIYFSGGREFVHCSSSAPGERYSRTVKNP